MTAVSFLVGNQFARNLMKGRRGAGQSLAASCHLDGAALSKNDCKASVNAVSPFEASR